MIRMVVNDQLRETKLHAATPIVDFLRSELKLCGTKIGCREGDCGACTIIAGFLQGNKIIYRSMASCIMPLINGQAKHIITIEGINLPQKELNPIQEAFIAVNAVQCGFCTPGFIMSLTAYALSEIEKTPQNAINSVAGNVCRCTGYKSIEKAVLQVNDLLQEMPTEFDAKIKWLVSHNILPSYFNDVKEMLQSIRSETSLTGNTQATIVAGGTDALVQRPEELLEEQISAIADIAQFKGTEIKDNKIWIGAATTVDEFCQNKEIAKHIPKIKDYLKLVSSPQIRNMATVAGNFANGSPIGDLSVMFLCLDTTLVLSQDGKKREMPLKDFFVGYKKVNKAENELIEQIYFPIPSANAHFSFEKISKRVHLDMATVNSAVSLKMESGKMEDVKIAIGGLGPTIRNMEKTCDFLNGKEISDETFTKANEIAQAEITPRSRANYKRLLVRQQLFLHLRGIAPDALSLEVLK